MKNENRTFYAYYNFIWHELFRSISSLGLEKGYEKLLKEYNIDDENYCGYTQILSAYVNDYDKIKLSLNPDYFNFVNIENLDEHERKVVYILAASLDLRINKPVFEIIYDKIVEENKLEGKYATNIAKYILKYRIVKNRDYVIKNLISEIFDESIVYKNLDKETFVVYTNKNKEAESNTVIKYIKKFFLRHDEKIRIFWGRHFTVLENREVSNINKEVIY